jgi:RHS repeat-associated protein
LTAAPPSNPTTSYTTTDHLGSPRVITNATGQVTSRRDFLPFGEELTVNVGNRSANQQYGTTDGIRQKFTGYQKDTETSLDFAEARMYENRFGRFTAVDPLLASGKSANPQTFNRYSYTSNHPIWRVDRNGRDWYEHTDTHVRRNGTSVSVRNIYWVNSDPTNLEGRTKYEGPGVFRETFGRRRGRWAAIDPYEGRAESFRTRGEAVAKYQEYLSARNTNLTRGFVNTLTAMGRVNPLTDAIYNALADGILGRPDPNSEVYTITSRTTGAVMTVVSTASGFAEVPLIAETTVEVRAGTETIHTVSTLEPGPFAQEPLPIRNGPVSASEQGALDEIGVCHTYGATDPGTPNGHFIRDHQPPSALAEPQGVYPHCLRCSTSQGGIVRGVLRGHYPNPYQDE